MSFSVPSKPHMIYVIAALGLMIVGAAALSLYVFITTSLRLDEAQSLFQTNRSIGGVLYLVGQDVHVPGYHIVLHYWQLVFGNDIHTARLLSLMFFIALIPTTYWLASYAFSSRRIGLFAALLLTISPFMEWYGSEARMYSMLAFFTVAHQLAFLKLYREGKPVHWVWYALTAAAGMYTHYFFAFVLLTDVAFYLLFRKKFAAAKALPKFLLVAIGVAAAVAPWLWYVTQLGFASNTQPSLAEPTSVDLFNTYTQFIFGFQVDALNTIIVSLWPIIVLLAFFGLQKNHRVPHESMFFMMAAIIPVCGAFLVSVTITPFFQSRYLIVALPALVIFVSWVISMYPRRIAVPLRIILVAVMLGLLVVQVVNPNTPVKEDYRQAVSYLNDNTTSRDVIILAAPFTIYPTEYYYQGTSKITTQPIWDRFSQGSVPPFDESKLPDDIKKSTASYQTAWIMLSYDQGYNEKIKQYMDGHYERIHSKEFSKGLNVYAYKLRYDPGVSLEK